MRRRSSWEIPRPWIYQLHESVSPDRAREFNGARNPASPGGRPIYRDEIMAHFDSLPPELRAALANVNNAWAPSWGYMVMRIGAWPLDVMISRVELADREEELQREMQLLRGEG